MKIIQKFWKRILISAVICTAISALVACSGGGSSSSATVAPVYTAIFDAGSSGTRVNLYKVTPGNGGYPQITLLDSQSYDDNGINDFILGSGFITPADWADSASGLSAGYAAPGCNINVSPVQVPSGVIAVANGSGNTASVGPCVLQPLLDSLASTLSKYGVTASQVKVELFATAGMRTVAYKNGGTKSDGDIAAFYQTMKDYVANTKGFIVGEFRTSNGNSEEGVWTWTNLNDQYYNVFGGNPTYSPTVQTAVGDFEVGGSSMQIAFPTTAAVSDANNVYPVKINGKTFNVYSKTFLGLGGDDSRKFMRAAGFNSGGTYAYNGGVECYASSADSSNTAESSGIALFNNSSIFPNSSSPAGNPAVNLSSSTWTSTIAYNAFPMVWTTQTGSWNASHCATRYSAITDNVISLPRNAAGTDNSGAVTSYTSLRNLIGASAVSFVGLDGFYYVSDSLNMANPTGFNATTFATALDQKCSSAIPNGTKPFTAQRTCPDGSYMNDFLFRANGGLFTNNGSAVFAGVQPPTQNRVSVLTWTRGYLLLKYAN